MAYPFSGFGTFLFRRSESPLKDTDTEWKLSPSYARTRPLGATVDSIVTVAIGSPVRLFECHLTPSRYNELRALINTSTAFVDWTQPTPDQRTAFLANVEIKKTVGAYCSDGTTEKKYRVKVTLVGQ